MERDMTEPSDGFIQGVFNYCDRWCERCPFTPRCRVFEAEQRDPIEPGFSDAFWERLVRTFEEVSTLVAEEAARRGIVVDDEALAAAEQALREVDAEAERHPVHVGAQELFARTSAWMTSHEATIEQAIDRARLARDLDPIAATGDRITPAVEVADRYSTLIPPKLHRALTPLDPAELEDPASDCNGSAKVALIAMDRAIAAWGVLHEELPAEQDSILDQLLALDRLRRATERAFPLARAFVRPGFDDGA